MAARDGMASLIIELRTRCDAGTADYQVAGSDFWTDDQLQSVLDRNRRDVKRETLMLAPELSGGSAIYHDYQWCREWVEEAASGTAIWRVEDSQGSLIGTASYTPEYGARSLRFASNTGGTAYFLTYRSYDLDRAAAEVWERKAGHVASRFDIKTDNHDLKRSQLVEQYRAMAVEFRRRAPAKIATRVRDDMPVEPRHDGPFKPVSEDW